MATEKLKRKRVKVKAGQLAAVPLLDRTFALVHVALYNGTVIAAHFAHRAATPETLLDGVDLAMKGSLIAILAITSDEIYDGLWAVIGHREPAYPAEMLNMKGRSYGAASSRALFEAYYGLRPWDEMFDPRYYEKQLLHGVPVPSTVRYKHHFAPGGATSDTAGGGVATETQGEPYVTEGPGEVHIEIKYPGEELPTIEMLKRRESIEQALESEGVGEVTNAGGGGGVMDIYLETQDVARTLPVARAAIQQAGFEGVARIEVNPLDLEGDSGGPENATAEDEAS